MNRRFSIEFEKVLGDRAGRSELMDILTNRQTAGKVHTKEGVWTIRSRRESVNNPYPFSKKLA